MVESRETFLAVLYEAPEGISPPYFCDIYSLKSSRRAEKGDDSIFRTFTLTTQVAIRDLLRVEPSLRQPLYAAVYLKGKNKFLRFLLWYGDLGISILAFGLRD